MPPKKPYPTPLYHLIYIVLKDKIINGTYPFGSKLPSENKIMDEFDVSRITARRAVEELEWEGFVRRRQGAGTTVIYRPEAFGSEKAGMEGLLENLQTIAKRTNVALHEFCYEPPPLPVRDFFGLPDDAIVQKSVRVRLLNDKPFSYVTAYVPEDIGRLYTEDDLRTTPLMALIEQSHAKAEKANQLLTAVSADLDMADKLDMNIGMPLLKVIRHVYDDQARPIQYLQVLYRPDVYQMAFTLVRAKDSAEGNWRQNFNLEVKPAK